MPHANTTLAMMDEIAAAFPVMSLDRLEIMGEGDLPSVFAVTDLAAASIAAAGLATTDLLGRQDAKVCRVKVDRRLASMWFSASLRPDGWCPPPPWDPIAGDYQCADGWIRLHTNAPRHKAAALLVLERPEDKALVTEAVLGWQGKTLETAVVEAGGCAAFMQSARQWAGSPAGASVIREPLVAWEETGAGPAIRHPIDAAKPLAGLKVLDLTRVLAGPVSTRFLAALGADVLRVDPPDWDEPGVVPEIMQGKRGTRLDLHDPDDRETFERLLAEADLLVHGYRNGALDALGYGSAGRLRINPELMEVALDAYGWTGPWKDRRGFDSLVQMSCGIAEAGMRLLGKDRPTPLPVQALDFATGYLMAAAAIRAVAERQHSGRRMRARLSLARTAALLMEYEASSSSAPLTPESSGDVDPAVEQTGWGPARRLRSPLYVEGVDLHPTLPAMPLGSHRPRWLTAAS